MENKLKEIMSNIFEVDIIKIDENTSPKTISQWDSFNHLNLVVKIEEELNLNFNEDEIVKMVDFNSIIKIIKNK